MSVLAFPPTLIPSASEFLLVSNTQIFESPLSGHVQSLELPGARWRANLTFDKLSEADGRDLAGFLAALRGRSGTFTLHDHSLLSPRGVGTGTPLVNGASQTGSTLITDGWTVSTPGIMKTGDLFQIGNELKILTADVASDSGGNATLIFESPIRTSPAENSAIIINSPKALMKLSSDDFAGYRLTAPTKYNLKLSCFEVF